MKLLNVILTGCWSTNSINSKFMCYLRLIILNFDRMTPKQKKFNEIIVLIDNWVNKIPWNMSEWAIKVNNLLFIALMCHFPLVNTRKMLDNAWYNDICSKSVIERLISMHLFTNFVYYVINVFIKCKIDFHAAVSFFDWFVACVRFSMDSEVKFIIMFS